VPAEFSQNEKSPNHKASSVTDKEPISINSDILAESKDVRVRD